INHQYCIIFLLRLYQMKLFPRLLAYLKLWFVCSLKSLIKVSRCEQTIMERAREVIQKEFEEETMDRLRKIKRSVLEPMQGAGSFSSTGNLDLRKKYASMPAAVTLAHIAALEKKLTKNFNIKDFVSLEQGTFLDFLVKHIQALASLLSCPLLEDVNNWSQWEMIFKPSHGPLKDFIESNAETGDKHFTSAVATLDPVGTAGHLVSMVAADGIDNAPTALLANHMENSLAAAVAEEDLSKAEEDVTCYSRVAKFLLRCLTRIPTRTCHALLQQVSGY
ncbi:hypothetical protein XENOCAPTIV_003213, partial [Xenoophorus captivus]